MKIACIQQAAKDITQHKETQDVIISLIDQAGKAGADLIVLPECSYPAYYLGYDLDCMSTAMCKIDSVIQAVSERARKHAAYIALGAAVKRDGKIFNAGLLFDRNGALAGSCDKSNLWHFDRKWFSRGSYFNVVDTDFGKVGLIICADGRAPEISRILALKGADIIIDMANLTSAGNDPSKLTNPQVEYMLPTRALENQVWIIMADKAGIEADSITYAGRSCIINPKGEMAAFATSDKQEILYADIDVNDNKKALYKRRPDSYKILTENTINLPVYKDMSVPLIIPDTELQAAIVQYDYKTEEAFISHAAKFIRTMEDQDAALILLPQMERNMNLMSAMEKIRNSMSCPTTVIALTGYRQMQGLLFKSTILASKGIIYGIYDKLHADEDGLIDGEVRNSVIQTPICKIGVMHDQEAMIPEVSRCLMLNGADVILWSDRGRSEKAEIIARTRASENKVYLMRVGREDCSIIVSPDGRVIGSTFSGLGQGASVQLVTALSKSKTVVPGTNVVMDRKPALYELLTT